MIFSLLLSIGFAQQVQLTEAAYTETVTIQVPNDSGSTTAQEVTRVKAELSNLFSEKFTCYKDEYGVYEDWANKMYPNEINAEAFYCCGYMANGRRQCDKMSKWRKVGDSHFTLCEMSYSDAVSENKNGPKLRRDLCCQNSDFNDCNLCKSFMVWDFTVSENSHGGDPELEKDLLEATNGKVTLEDTWREEFNRQPKPQIEGVGYPPYAYDNNVYPGGFARATLREFNDPPVCVYAPNVAGRVIEIKVEPEESGSQVCVDDLHEDSLEKNAPGVTQACDDSRLQTCFSDANSEASSTLDGFAFLISCAESCANGDVDLWFRLRASVNKWTESGDSSKGTDQTEVSTEMWCMWANQDMRDEDGNANFPDVFPDGLDGNFAKWDVYPSDLTPEEDPVVRPVQSGVSLLSFGIALFSVLALIL